MNVCTFVYNRQVGLNLVIPGGARTVDARGMMVIPGKSDEAYTANCRGASGTA